MKRVLALLLTLILFVSSLLMAAAEENNDPQIGEPTSHIRFTARTTVEELVSWAEGLGIKP